MLRATNGFFRTGTRSLIEPRIARQINHFNRIRLHKMESEERPSKIRKLDHGSKDGRVASLLKTDSSESIEITGTDSMEKTSKNINSIGSQEVPDVSGKNQQPENSLDDQDTAPDTVAKDETSISADPPLSKNALKKLRKKQEWEASRESRIQQRREKRVAARERKKERKAEAREVAAANGLPASIQQPTVRRVPGLDIPMTFLIDCDFDELMKDSEMVSMAGQITRCYSENRKAQFRPTLAISSFSGRLKTRFETTLRNSHERWSGVQVETGDFVDTAEKVRQRMIETETEGLQKCSALEASKEISPEEGEVIYLTADSDHTLDELKPYSTYILGGIVDRNRHKGICYKRARDRNIKTAKLPIGEFMQMNSRAVLATNHVYEIMLKWLECKDWGEAFMKAIPKRKGGVLKGQAVEESEEEDDVEEADDLKEAGFEMGPLTHAGAGDESNALGSTAIAIVE